MHLSFCRPGNGGKSQSFSTPKPPAATFPSALLPCFWKENLAPLGSSIRWCDVGLQGFAGGARTAAYWQLCERSAEDGGRTDESEREKRRAKLSAWLSTFKRAGSETKDARGAEAEPQGEATEQKRAAGRRSLEQPEFVPPPGTAGQGGWTRFCVGGSRARR